MAKTTPMVGTIQSMRASISQFASTNVSLQEELKEVRQELDAVIDNQLELIRKAQKRMTRDQKDYLTLKAIILGKPESDLPEDPKVYVNRVLHMRQQVNRLRDEVERLRDENEILKSQPQGSFGATIENENQSLSALESMLS